MVMMTSIDGRYDERSNQSMAIGLVVLQSDEVMESELRHWLPSSMRLLHTRIPNSVEVTAQTLAAMKGRLADATALLPSAVDYAVIAYGCTSASTVIGEDEVCKQIHSVFPGVAVTNPITALKARLQNLGIRRIALLTPYSMAVSTAIVDHLNDAGFSIEHAATFDEARDDRVARIANESVLQAMVELGSRAECQAVFASCTNLRALPILDEVEQRINKPALTSNSVLAWHIQHLADAREETLT